MSRKWPLITSLLMFPLMSLLAVWIVAIPVEAQSATMAQAKGGITVSPAFQDIDISATQKEVRYDFAITNNTSESQDFELSLVDFGSLDETGGLLFVGKGEETLKDYKYGLSAWARPEQNRITVASKSTVKVPVIIANDESMAPGGHYGAILVSAASTGGQVGVKVQLNQIASALLFVKKEGGEIYKLGLDNYDVDNNLLALPGKVNLRFHNTGNVHVRPRGLVTLTDPRGNIVRRGIINEESGLVLPDTYRKLATPLASLGNAWMPGKYTLTVSYRLDNQVAVQTETATILYVNPGYAAAIISLLSVIIFVIANRRARTRTKRFLQTFSQFVIRPFRRL